MLYTNSNVKQTISQPFSLKNAPLVEKAINEQVLRHLESNKLIHDRQYGFRQHRSTGDILAHVTHIWNKTWRPGMRPSLWL